MSQESSADVSEAEIAVHWQEEDYVKPSEKFIAQANLTAGPFARGRFRDPRDRADCSAAPCRDRPRHAEDPFGKDHAARAQGDLEQ
ncbi:hypothetical protein D9M68_208510 [compost metagenome]